MVDDSQVFTYPVIVTHVQVNEIPGVVKADKSGQVPVVNRFIVDRSFDPSVQGGDPSCQQALIVPAGKWFPTLQCQEPGALGETHPR